MRKIIVLSFISLDGVMQGPGGPDEDKSGGFTLGGWTVPYFDEALGLEMTKQMDKPFDLLLGRKTFDLFAGYWPDHPDDGAGINKATKYVLSNSMTEHSWQKTVCIKGDVVSEIKKIKEQEGPDLQVHGSCSLVQILLQNDLVDELWLKTFPVVIGKGKRLFGDGVAPAAFELIESKSTPSGVIISAYKKAGEVKTGTF